MGKLIDITEILKDCPKSNVVEEMQEAVADLDVDDKTLNKIKDYIVAELKIMLGMSELDEEVIESIDPVFFDEIQDVYDQSNDHCYFCSPMADPNDEEYGEFRRACPICTMKLKSFMKAAGIADTGGKVKKANRHIGIAGRC